MTNGRFATSASIRGSTLLRCLGADFAVCTSGGRQVSAGLPSFSRVLRWGLFGEVVRLLPIAADCSRWCCGTT